MNFEDVYRTAVDDLSPSDDFKKRLLKEEENHKMKWNKKKVVLVTLIACMVLGTTAVAGGRATSTRGWSDPRKKITDYADAVEKAYSLGSELEIPETFCNGYGFEQATEDHFEGLDENDHVVYEGSELDALYVKEGAEDMHLSIQKIFQESEEAYAVDTKVIGDVTVYYNEAFYKYVPVGYELTDEDKVNLENPHYEISDGADTVEEKSYYGVSFKKNNVYYSMWAWDSGLSKEEWFVMAEELLTEN